MTYRLCKALANKDKLTANMLDIYLAARRITEEQYNQLLELI